MRCSIEQIASFWGATPSLFIYAPSEHQPKNGIPFDKDIMMGCGSWPERKQEVAPLLHSARGGNTRANNLGAFGCSNKVAYKQHIDSCVFELIVTVREESCFRAAASADRPQSSPQLTNLCPKPAPRPGHEP